MQIPQNIEFIVLKYTHTHTRVCVCVCVKFAYTWLHMCVKKWFQISRKSDHGFTYCVMFLHSLYSSSLIIVISHLTQLPSFVISLGPRSHLKIMKRAWSCLQYFTYNDIQQHYSSIEASKGAIPFPNTDESV